MTAAGVCQSGPWFLTLFRVVRSPMLSVTPPMLRRMLELRADPWAPEYGMGFQPAVSEEEREPLADPFVETRDWSTPIDAPPGPASPLWFVDGVRRVEVGLQATDGGRSVPGLFGSWAVGTVRCDGRAAFGEHAVGRALVLGGGVVGEPVELRVGSHVMRFEPRAEPGLEPDRPLWGLQQVMRAAEANLASRLAGADDAMVLVDGPLMFRDPTRAAVVGVVKRFAREYLRPEQDRLLARLRPGQRSPVFAIGAAEASSRLAWYARLVDAAGPWHDHAGLVRCEVRAAIRVPAATSLADRISALLPSFAGRPSDPRFPQNLLPVGALEARLRHRMGDRALVRRALVTWLATRARGAA